MSPGEDGFAFLWKSHGGCGQYTTGEDGFDLHCLSPQRETIEERLGQALAGGARPHRISVGSSPVSYFHQKEKTTHWVVFLFGGHILVKFELKTDLISCRVRVSVPSL